MQCVPEKAQALQGHPAHKGQVIRKAALHPRALRCLLRMGHKGREGRMLHPDNAVVRAAGDHPHAVLLRGQHRFDVQPFGLSGDLHPNLRPQRLGFLQLGRGHGMQGVHARVAVPGGNPKGHAQVNPALIRAGNAHAHGVLEQIRIQPRGKARHAAPGMPAGSGGVQGNGGGLGTAGGFSQHSGDLPQKHIVVHGLHPLSFASLLDIIRPGGRLFLLFRHSSRDAPAGRAGHSLTVQAEPAKSP